MQIGFSGSTRKSAGATRIIVPLGGYSVRNFVFDPTMHLSVTIFVMLGALSRIADEIADTIPHLAVQLFL
jgi:hypothetical protein